MEKTEGRPTALLVDDDDVTRFFTLAVLEEKGFAVTEVDSGEAALAAFQHERADVVLLDALMPGIDGFDTCRKIRAIPGGEHVPVLMLTGLDDEGSIARAYEAGATDFFVKSDHWALLVQRIRYLLRASRMRDELAKSRAKEARAQRIARLGHWEWDIPNRQFLASEECFRLMGQPTTQKAIPEKQFWQCLHIEDQLRVKTIVERALKDGNIAQLECRLVGADGLIRTVHFESEAEHDEHGVAFRMHGVIQDITERKHTEDQIRLLANYDSLTGLANRRLFREQFSITLERAHQSGGCVAVLFVDLDRFKQINDTLGHAAGDQLLIEVAGRLNRSVRDHRLGGRNADVVARLGGDEFTIMLAELNSPADAEIVARRVLSVLREPVRLVGQECITSGSIGIAVFPRDGEDAETMLRNADTAMYAAKANGKNNMQVYKPGPNAVSKDRLILEHALHKALERNQLILHYQPQIDTRLGKIVGAEALMRWQHEGKLVPPGEFIPLAEEVGLIIPFGEWAIKTTVGQNRAWVDMGFEALPIAVNIPGSHFERANFVEQVQEVLKRQGLDAKYLELEITETTLMQNLSATLPTLDALTALGIRLSVDDFGTGYSSLSYLRRLPIDTLKIDASFVRDLQKGSDNEAIVAAIIAMASSLNLRVIAEGVETYDQMCLLHAYGCHIMQGYYFSRPVPAADFAAFRREYGDQKQLPAIKSQSKSSVVSLLRAAGEKAR